MPDPAISAALREAYASAPASEVIFHTLELWHPNFTAPLRVVRDQVALEARLEDGAPRDAGAVVTFVPYAFDIVPPDQSSTAAPECVIEIDNVSREILAQIDLAVASVDPVSILYREYVASGIADGPETDPPLEMEAISASATARRIRLKAGFPNLLNVKFPALDYDLDHFPGLQP